jgi:magnesium chelatase family protein
VTTDIDRNLERSQLTLRGYDRVVRVAWTVADLGGRVIPTREDLGTALSLRNQGTVAA